MTQQDLTRNQLPTKAEIIMMIFEQARSLGFTIPDSIRGIDIEVCWPLVLYRHDFARAYWGLDQVALDNLSDAPGQRKTAPAWEYHLVEMTLDVDPLGYCEKFLKKA